MGERARRKGISSRFSISKGAAREQGRKKSESKFESSLRRVEKDTSRSSFRIVFLLLPREPSLCSHPFSPSALLSLSPAEQALLAPAQGKRRLPPHAAQQAHLRSRRRRTKRNDGFFFSSFDAAFSRRIVDDEQCRSSPKPLPPPGLGLARRGPAFAGQVVRALRRLV